MDVHKEKWTLGLADQAEGRVALRLIQRRALISEFNESHFVASIGWSANRIHGIGSGIGMIRAVPRAGGQESNCRYKAGLAKHMNYLRQSKWSDKQQHRS